MFTHKRSKSQIVLLLTVLAVAVLAAPAGAKSSGRLSPDLQRAINSQPPSAKTTVVVQAADVMTAADHEAVRALGGIVLYEFRSTNIYALRLPVRSVERLSSLTKVLYVSADRETKSTSASHLAATTGAELVYPTARTTGVDGKGVAIAILDTGIAPTGEEFADTSASPAKSSTRIKANRGFEGIDRSIRIQAAGDLTAQGKSRSPSGSTKMQYFEDKNKTEQKLTIQLDNLPAQSQLTLRFNGIPVSNFTTGKTGSVQLDFAAGADIKDAVPLPWQFEPCTIVRDRN